MKLFLASAFSQTADLLVEKIGDITGKKVIFIENASDVDEVQDKWWIRVDREAFEKLGCQIINVDLRSVLPDQFEKIIKDSHIIHFCGGSVFYLINLIKERGFMDIIVNNVRADKIIYTGTSAGSMIPSVDLSVDKNDPLEEDIVSKINDFSGLGLIDFVIMPHANDVELSEENKKVIDDIAIYKTAVFYLCDNQAIWVEGKHFELLTK